MIGDIPEEEYRAALESLKQFYKDHPEHAAKYPADFEFIGMIRAEDCTFVWPKRIPK